MTGRFRFRLNRQGANLHADEAGQISALAVMSAAAFACLLVLIINVGTGTSEKIELQNAADATALSGAAWIARGMNVVSMNNVTQSQLLAIILIIPALDKAAQAADITLQIEQKIACALSWTGVGAVVCVAVTAELVFLKGVRMVITGIKSFATRGSVLWQAMEALSKISAAVRLASTAMAEAEAYRIARENGAEAGALIPAGLSLVLPIHAGKMNPDLCDPTKNGNRGGYETFLKYPRGDGPFEYYSNKIKWFMRYPLFTSGFNWWFDAFREVEYVQLCGVSGQRLTTVLPVNDLATCRAGGGSARWVLTNYQSVLFASRRPGFSIPPHPESDLAGAPYRSRLEVSCSWTPPGVRIGPDEYRLTQETRTVVGTDDNGDPIVNYSYDVYEYGFAIGSVQTTVEGGQGGAGGGGGGNNDPAPYLLGTKDEPTPDAARRLLHYLGVVYRSRNVALAPDYFKPALGDRRLAYAQVRVYNPTAFDLFTQDWRVTLEPALLMEDGTLFGGLAGGSNVKGATDLGGVLGRAKDFFSPVFANLMAALNNH